MNIPINPNNGQPVDNYRKNNKVGESHPRAKLTQYETNEIRRLVAEGVDRKFLSVRFGISKSTISRIVTRPDQNR